MSPVMLEVSNLSKYYGPRAAVRDLSFTASKGEVIGLLGRNGAGKTTTLRMLSGLLTPTRGSVRVQGFDLVDAPEKARANLGFLPETPPLYPEMSVEGYLRFVGKINALKGAKLAAAVDRALSVCSLTDRRTHRIDTLSFGYRRRVGLAHVIVHSPPLILLDEPTSGLDPTQVGQMRELIRGLQQEHTIIVSSHILTEIEALCDRLIILREGETIAMGTSAELSSGMEAKSRLEVQVRGDELEVAKVLESAEGVSAVKPIRAHGGLASFAVEGTQDVSETVAREIIQNGFGLRGLQAQAIDLEEIFVRLTEEGVGNQPSAST